jgi:plasmid stabilization system protein ParE
VGKVKIELTESAIADLEDIENYIALDSPAIARRFLSKIFDRIEQLKNYPESGK